MKTNGLGQGGIASAFSLGSAGAGFTSNGASDSSYGTGGASWGNGLVGGDWGSIHGGNEAFGGFGGGGAGNGSDGGGGGGGYSGGDGGLVAGGGGSFNAGANQSGTAGFESGDGLVTITFDTPDNPTIVSTASSAVTLGTTAPTLSDSAVLANGSNETGSLVFTLSGPGGFSYTHSDTLSGNGTYSASDTLPPTGTVAGTYTWHVSYAGDANNNGASDQGGTAVQTVVSAANPTITSTASSAVTLGTKAPTLSAAAVLAGGYYETGSLVFTLSGPGGFSYTQSDTLSGNGAYSADDTLPTTGTVAGSYTWSVSYAGDANNNGASDPGGTAEPTVVSAANPTITSTASPAVTLGTTAPTLSDSAVLAGGYSETTSLVFTLSGPDGFSYTQSDTLSGNGAYSASDTLPPTGTVAGTYTWHVSYAGDANNNGASDQGGTAVQTVVSAANPTITSTASSAVTLGTKAPTLSAAAVLAGGYYETGSLVFTLTGPAGFTYTQSDTLNGNGTYSASDTLPITGTVAGTYTWHVSYAGDANNNAASDQGGSAEQTVVSAANPTITTTAGPAVTLGTTAPTLSDSAVLAGGYYETGSLVFTLTGPAGFSYTQSDTLSGNGTYSASDTLPTTGTVAGTYTWSVSYAGDANNNGASDQGGSAEQTVVSAANPTITTTAGPAVTLGTTAPTLSDSAVLAGGYYQSGSLVFTLTGPAGFSYTQSDTLSGNGTYSASDTLPTTGTVAGTYTWSVSYAGDANNNGASDQGGSAEQTVVSAANPTITTTAGPAVTLGTTAPTLSDSAVLAGGYYETGSLVFTLTGPAGFSYTQSDTLSGNGTYSASDTLPTTGTVAGTYTWSVSYAGDANNNGASDQGGSAEQTVVSAANPTITSTASPAITLGTTAPTLSDSAVLAGGYYETGSLVFTLSGPNGFSYTQSDTLSGNGTYSASDTLPTTGTVASTYTWHVSYAGDANNNGAVDQGGTADQTAVSAANPTITATASSAITLGTTAPTLSDSAVLAGGYYETGSVVFTLSGPAGFSYTHSDTLSGNGTYSANDTLPTTGTVAGTYTWSVSYAGDANNNGAVDQGGTGEQTVVSAANPTITTTAGPAVTLGTTAPTLSDSAVLAGGYYQSGSLVFTLTGPAGFSYTQSDTLSGNGTYSASDTLPTTGTVAGTYTWSVSYAGDANNNGASDQGGSAEQTVVSAANPTITSTASPAITLGTTAPTLSDSAVLAGGYYQSGSLVFTLTGPAGFSYTQSDTLSGNGTYSASDTLPTTGTVAGTYTWSVSYAGDANNNGASDQGGSAEQTVVSAANPTITSTASPAITLGTTAPTLSDSAVLAGGYYETGSLVFTLSGPDGFSYTQSDTLSGNGTYSASDTLPTTGTVASTYTWHVSYAGDANNNGAVDQGGTAEQTAVSAANPTITATASSAITLGTTAPTLSDSAVLAGGYYETGSVVFTLSGPAGFSYTHSDTLSGNGTYSASDTLPTTGTVAGTYTWSVSYAGDANNNGAVDQGGTAEQTVVSAANPTITTTASPAITLGTTAPTLSDSAVLAGGYYETGSLVFTLSGPDGFSYTQSDTLSGNGTYSASDTLPTTGTVAGTYTWHVSYAGDANNNGASDQDGKAEQTVVSAANPTITTTASPAITLGTTAPTLSDSAVLAGGYYQAGSLVFTLTGPAGFSYTQSDTLSGNGTYSASDTLPITGTVAGTYTWHVSYAGDANNNGAVDQGGTAEQTVVSAANPTITTTASPAVTLGTTAPTLSDSAVLAGGYYQAGSLVFTLTGPAGFSYTQSDTLSGNGTYRASDTLPITGTVAGTYTWHVSYAGDANNNGAVDQGGTAEQTVVSAANPTITATASSAITLGTTAPTLSDSAVLAGGYYETGSLVFTLSGPGGFSYTHSDTLSGNGTYTASDTLPTTGTVAGTYTWHVSYAGDANNNGASDQDGKAEQTVVSAANPTITTTASPAIRLGTTAPTLSDSAVLAGGYYQAGSLVFTLTGPAGFSYTQSDTLSGNGTYSASDTLPITGTVAGTYTWHVSYAGDANNNGAVDQGGTAEQTVVSAANPTITTTASPAVTLGTTAPTLSDSAVLAGGYYETGSLVFTLSGPGGFSYTHSDTLSGNGTYSASDTLPTTGTVAGTYTWHVSYAGDANNNGASDQGGKAEQTVVSAANPTITTTASPAVTLGTTAPTLSDSAVLAGGYYETGSLVFTLSGPAGFSYTQSDTLSGNGTYSASDTLPTTGTVAGTYTWHVGYAGDANSNGAVDQGGTAEQTVVSAANSTITASAGATVVLGTGTKLTATATLAGGHSETGTITFKLYGPNSDLVDTETATVSGNCQCTTPNGYLPSSAGTYHWVASYADSNNVVCTTNGSTPEVAVAPGVTVVGDALYLVGGNSNDQLNITPIGTSQTGSTGFKVNGKLNNININNQSYTNITTIHVAGFGGNDNFTFANSLTIATVVGVGDGNDNIQLAGGTNAVSAGNGNDNIQAGNGSNTVMAGNGNINVNLGNGNNHVTVGNGNDNVQLGNGTNTVTAGTGNDNINAGDGTNTVTAGAVGSRGNIHVQLGNGAHNSVTLLGNGNDHVQAGNGNNDAVTISGNGNNQIQLGDGNNDYVSMSGNGNDQAQVGNGTDDFVSIVGNGNEGVQTGRSTGKVHVAGTGRKNLHLGSGWTQI